MCKKHFQYKFNGAVISCISKRHHRRSFYFQLIVNRSQIKAIGFRKKNFLPPKKLFLFTEHIVLNFSGYYSTSSNCSKCHK